MCQIQCRNPYRWVPQVQVLRDAQEGQPMRALHQAHKGGHQTAWEARHHLQAHGGAIRHGLPLRERADLEPAARRRRCGHGLGGPAGVRGRAVLSQFLALCTAVLLQQGCGHIQLRLAVQELHVRWPPRLDVNAIVVARAAEHVAEPDRVALHGHVVPQHALAKGGLVASHVRRHEDKGASGKDQPLAVGKDLALPELVQPIKSPPEPEHPPDELEGGPRGVVARVPQGRSLREGRHPASVHVLL
mmetsp:Transcript_49482/g.152687  ORF Transcript_49482/g.152687 Transcript_49482/m.152687 type:complete len:245 (-) Transcript_49482:888-1622(-)